MTTRIDRHNYPGIFTVCLAILGDSGAINRVDTPEGWASLIFLLPAHPADGFGRMEAAVCELAGTDDLNTLAIGEESEAQAVADRDPDLLKLHGILNRWFEQGMPYEK